jgi:TctA family transporter
VDALAALAALLSSPQLLGLMGVAVVVGMVFGAVPGVGGKTAIVLAIPFVFGMDPVPGAVFLLAMHAVVHTGGSIPSILFGIPGTGADAATVVDGHPMAEKGEAGRALGASLSASAVGGVIGAVALALFLPVVRPLLLLIGPAETFLLAVFGLTFIGVLAGPDPVKGLAVGTLGVLMATVGMDPKTGIPRYAFGQLFLWEGVDLTTAVLAFFAVPEMISLGARGGRVSSVQPSAANTGWRALWRGVTDVARHPGLTLRTSLIGTGIGLIPGIGGDVATWICYGHAVQSSKEPERFGHGAVEGVIAPETANNAKEGGALVPTLFFAIPGSSGMALLLGAFAVLGLAPGPTFLLEHGDLVWILIWTLAVSNLMGAALMLFASRWLALAAFMPTGALVPMVLVLALIGSYAVASAWESLVLLSVLGVLGWLLKRSGWPRAPFAVGLILGGILEVSLDQSLTIWGPAFLLRPATPILLGLTGIGLWWSRSQGLKGTNPDVA